MGSSLYKRKVNVREIRTIPGATPKKMALSFMALDQNQIPPGFSYAQLQKAGKLDGIFERFEQICDRSVEQAQKEDLLTIYGAFPEKSEFDCPPHLKGEDLRWAVIRRINGQKGRLAGYIDDEDVFHVVFLDMNHKFWPTRRK